MNTKKTTTENQAEQSPEVGFCDLLAGFQCRNCGKETVHRKEFCFACGGAGGWGDWDDPYFEECLTCEGTGKPENPPSDDPRHKPVSKLYCTSCHAIFS